MINVASFQNSVGYGKWTRIDGWSESVVEYIRTLDQTKRMN
jgi:60 kDa SS-A/Ro ribonucleoprotein